jgi:hypothetical protein
LALVVRWLLDRGDGYIAIGVAMRPGKYRTARKGPKPTDVTKWVPWVLLAVIASLAHSLWAELRAHQNRQAVLIGKSVDCVERPSFDYFARCNALHDGAACTHESRSRMMEFYEPIDYACAQLEPSRVFRFPVEKEPETLEVAEVSG